MEAHPPAASHPPVASHWSQETSKLLAWTDYNETLLIWSLPSSLTSSCASQPCVDPSSKPSSLLSHPQTCHAFSDLRAFACTASPFGNTLPPNLCMSPFPHRSDLCSNIKSPARLPWPSLSAGHWAHCPQPVSSHPSTSLAPSMIFFSCFLIRMGPCVFFIHHSHQCLESVNKFVEALNLITSNCSQKTMLTLFIDKRTNRSCFPPPPLPFNAGC